MADGAALPGWPRALREEWAAAYCGLSRSTFRAEVAPRVKSVRLTAGRVAWLRDDLDEWLDARRHGGQDAAGGTNDDEIRALAAELAAPQGRSRRRQAPR